MQLTIPTSASNSYNFTCEPRQEGVTYTKPHQVLVEVDGTDLTPAATSSQRSIDQDATIDNHRQKMGEKKINQELEDSMSKTTLDEV